MQIIYYFLLGIFLLPIFTFSFILFPKFDAAEKNELFHSINKRNFKTSPPASDNNEPGVVIRLTEKLSNLLTSERSKEYLMKQFHGFTTPDFQFKALQMNVNIYKTSLVKAEAPEINFKFQNPHSFSIKTSGGFAQFRGLYKGVYRTCRDGQVYIDLSGLNLSLQVDLTRSNDGKKFAPKISSCEFTIDEIFVEMKRPLFPQATEAFKQIFLEYLSNEMCKFAENYATKIGDKFQETLENSPISLKELGLHKFDSTLIREPILDKNNLFFALNGKFGEKEENERSRVEMFESDTTHMIYTYISDFVFNEFLESFKNKELKLEESLKLNELIKSQSILDFDEKVNIEIKFNESPKIEFMDYGAKLQLNFNAILKTSDETLISANFDLKTLIEKFEIKALLDSDDNSDNDYKLNAKVTIDDIEIGDIISYLPEAFNLAETLPAAIKANKDVLEELIESNLHSLFPIETNSYLRVSTIKGFFRSRTLIFGFDFASSGNLIRHLQLP